jgi:hypothetical protein
VVANQIKEIAVVRATLARVFKKVVMAKQTGF